MMNIRQAILKAADSIEQHPKMFSFGSLSIPGCGSPGCALGWTGHHLGMRGYGLKNICIAIGLPLLTKYKDRDDCWRAMTFYTRMTELIGSGDWRNSAPECAKALRLYADKYHPAEHKRFHKALIPAEPDYHWNKEVCHVDIG